MVTNNDGEEGSEGSDSSSSSGSSSETSSKFSFRRLTRHQKALLISIYLTEFLIMCCCSLISPLLPPEANRREISGQTQGWIMASFAGGQFIIFPVFGKFVTKVGAKFMYLSGIFICGGCTVLFGSLQFVEVDESGTIFITLGFILQVAMSVGITAEQTSAFTVSSKEFSGCFTVVFGLSEVFVGLGLTVGPLVGGFLSSVGGFCMPFFVLGGMVLVSLVFNYCLIPTIQDEPQVAKLRRKSGLGLLRHPSIIITCLAVVAGSAVWSVLDPILEPHLALYNLSPTLVGAVFLLLSASYAISCAFCGMIADKLPDNRLFMIPGFVLCGLAHCLLGPTPLFGFDTTYHEIWLVIVSLVLLGIAMSMSVVPSYDIIMEIATETGYPDNLSTHGLVAGLWSSMYALGDFIGPIWGGYIQDDIGFAWGLTYTAGACIIIAVLLTVIALYDCYCCEVEEDEDELTEKKTLIQNPAQKTVRSRSISEPVVRGRRLAPVLESSKHFDLMESFSSTSWTSAFSVDSMENFCYHDNRTLVENDNCRTKNNYGTIPQAGSVGSKRTRVKYPPLTEYNSGDRGNNWTNDLTTSDQEQGNTISQDNLTVPFSSEWPEIWFAPTIPDEVASTTGNTDDHSDNILPNPCVNQKHGILGSEKREGEEFSTNSKEYASDIFSKNQMHCPFPNGDINNRNHVYPTIVITNPSGSFSEDTGDESGIHKSDCQLSDGENMFPKQQTEAEHVAGRKKRKRKKLKNIVIGEFGEMSSQKLSKPVTVNPRDGIRSPLLRTFIEAYNTQAAEEWKPTKRRKMYRRTLSSPAESEAYTWRRQRKYWKSMSINDQDYPVSQSVSVTNDLTFTAAETMQSGCMF